ncbi:RHS repeat-associated core domain-containing protein, partial [Lonsdalea quercina]
KRYLGDAANEEVYCELRYQGQIYDAETGLYYNRHRYYDADSGQYISPDPIGLAGGLRPQGYVHNPLEWVDPFGLDKKGSKSKLEESSDTAFDSAKSSVSDWTPKDKHMEGSTAKRAAQFNTNDVEDVRGIVRESLNSPNAQFYPNNQDGSFRVVTDLGRQIGTKGQTRVRVIVGDDGKIWNAFPVNEK